MNNNEEEKLINLNQEDFIERKSKKKWRVWQSIQYEKKKEKGINKHQRNLDEAA